MSGICAVALCSAPLPRHVLLFSGHQDSLSAQAWRLIFELMRFRTGSMGGHVSWPRPFQLVGPQED